MGACCCSCCIDVSMGAAVFELDSDGTTEAHLAAQTPAQSIPVVLLSGFLGAGKTTTIKHLLESQSAAKRIGVIANDVAAVNIDAKLIRDMSAAHVEMSNGCVCCTAADTLESNFEVLLLAGPFDVIVVESTGVAEPREVRKVFLDMQTRGRLRGVTLQRMITVVDSGAFLDEVKSADVLHARPDLGGRGSTATNGDVLGENDAAEGTGVRIVADLLIEQVECADIVLLNKIDQIDSAQMEGLVRLVEALNPRASVEAMEWGKAGDGIVIGNTLSSQTTSFIGSRRSGLADELRTFVAAHKKEEAGAPAAAGGHGHSHGGGGVLCFADHKHDNDNDNEWYVPTRAETRFGIRSFVYERRRPFCTPSLAKHVFPLIGATNDFNDKNPFAKIVRAKGFVWQNDKHDDMLYWSHAGKAFTVLSEGLWWAAKDQALWPSDVTKLEDILKDFDDGEGGRYIFGDRRNEIVFISCTASYEEFVSNQRAICDALDASLVNGEDEWEAFENAKRRAEDYIVISRGGC